MYKMVVEITKETWEKCGIKTLIYLRKNEQHQNTTWAFKYCWCWLKRIRKYYGKKTEDITEEEKQKYKAYFKGKEGAFIVEKLARDIIEHCKLPEAIELRKKLGYNHDDIMVREETSIAEKKIKIFPNENIVLKKNLITENQILKIKILLMKLMKEIMKIMSQMMKKKEKTCLKSIILNFFDVIPMILILIFLNLLAK